MHGRNRRSAGFPPVLKREEIQGNLVKIADQIREYNPDIVTLQEVDEESVLSGSFNQIDFLNNYLVYPYTYFAPHCSIILFGKKIFVSGTAILSRYPLENCASYDFGFSFPTERKGFVIADVQLPGGVLVSVASVHIVWVDWMRFNSQWHQLKLVEQVLRTKNNSVVIAGDMNCDFLGQEASLRPFVSRLNLHVYEPESNAHDTYTSWSPFERTDFILTLGNITFLSHQTVRERVSDHLAVFAELSI